MTKSRRFVIIAMLSCAPALVVGALALSVTTQAPNIRIQFVGAGVGYIVGPQLLQTTDAGHTWRVIRREGYGTFEIESGGLGHRIIQFVEPNVGFQLDLNAVAKTTDGGRTWSPGGPISKSDAQATHLQSLFFLSPEVGWVVGRSVYRTSDGGRSWEQLSPTPRGDSARQRNMRIAPDYADFMPAIWFTDKNVGLIARLDGEIYRTDDGGITWDLVLRVDQGINDIFFTNNRQGWVAGDEGFIARTDDGGLTWTIASTPTRAHLTGIFFLNGRTGWAVGVESVILYTVDGGVTWKKAAVTGLWGSPPLASVSFANESNGWAVGGKSVPATPSILAPSNVILTSDDGGRTWHPARP